MESYSLSSVLHAFCFSDMLKSCSVAGCEVGVPQGASSFRRTIVALTSEPNSGWLKTHRAPDDHNAGFGKPALGTASKKQSSRSRWTAGLQVHKIRFMTGS